MKISIKVNGVLMSLDIDPNKEEIYRRAQKMLNQRIDLYIHTFKEASYEDVIHMVAYEFAVEYEKLLSDKEKKPLDILMDTIGRMDDLIESGDNCNDGGSETSIK